MNGKRTTVTQTMSGWYAILIDDVSPIRSGIRRAKPATWIHGLLRESDRKCVSWRAVRSMGSSTWSTKVVSPLMPVRNRTIGFI
jgi:hypothetical protein